MDESKVSWKVCGKVEVDDLTGHRHEESGPSKEAGTKDMVVRGVGGERREWRSRLPGRPSSFPGQKYCTSVLGPVWQRKKLHLHKDAYSRKGKKDRAIIVEEFKKRIQYTSIL